MKIQSKQLTIGSLGVVDLSLPLIEVSSGVPGPRIVFIANQHGNEITPLFVLKELLALLKKYPLKKGTVVIISTANPLGLLFDSRQEPLDGDNLNRSFPGSSQKDLGKRIASAVFGEARKADLVVDLHTFSRQCPFLGILVKTGGEMEQICSKALRVIAPECIWQIDMERDADKHFSGALDLALVQEGVPAIALEMERHLTISSETISRIANSLFRLLSSYGMSDVSLSDVPQKEIPVFVSHYLYTDGGGIFVPSKNVFDEVRKGDVLGSVADIRTFAEEPVRAPVSGILLTVRFRDFVRTGSRLGSIGEQKDVL
ncbi:MAG: succinylglutamate desuccinylase/aspartoacylase family protein [Parcubacteria group bacterium]|nr:succinylglutamate desuccinylase/aspartoacylase family protein [Parcubacteria group bacterium]